MKINRLFQIVYILLEKQTITAKELAERFEVSVRTIYRDIDALSESGIPIYTNQGKGGGISLLDTFVLDKSTITAHEQQQILMALQQVQATNFVDVDATLDKLSTIFQLATTNWITIDFSRWGNSGQDNQKFEIVRDAIIEKYCIQFMYFGTTATNNQRLIEPLQVVFKNKAWYVIGYCLEKQAIRLFKMNRMKDVIRTEQMCIEEIREFGTFLQQESKAGRELTLAFSLAISFRVYDEFDSENIKKEDDRLVVQITYPEDEWLYSYLLSFGVYVEIISPIDLRETLKERSMAVARHYQQPNSKM